jgi:hypothetical protein
VANDDPVVIDQHLFDHQTHDALALEDVQCVRGRAQSRKECGQRLDKAEVRRLLVQLIRDGL